MMDYKDMLSNIINRNKLHGNERLFLEVDVQSDKFPLVSVKNPSDQSIKYAYTYSHIDYLGLATSPISVPSSKDPHLAIGSSGSRYIGGTRPVHTQLERKLANLTAKESALLFPSGFQANYTTACVFGRKIPNLVYLIDSDCHSSIKEGVIASGKRHTFFEHNDLCSLKNKLVENRVNPILVIAESLYSMDGTIAPLEEIIRLSKSFNALSMVDESHSIAVMGQQGRGLCQSLPKDLKPDLITFSLSKSLGCQGGALAGDKLFVDLVRTFGSGFIFTSALDPQIVSRCSQALSDTNCLDQRRAELAGNVNTLRHHLKRNKVQTLSQDSHIISVPVSGANQCKEICATMLEKHDYLLIPIIYPSVKLGKELIRLTVTPLHSEKEIIKFSNVFSKLVLRIKNETN